MYKFSKKNARAELQVFVFVGAFTRQNHMKRIVRGTFRQVATQDRLMDFHVAVPENEKSWEHSVKLLRTD
jgi:hypothetical protein